MSFIEAEASVFPFDHTEVGLLIADRWNFSEEIKAVVRRHHESWEQLEHAALLVKLIKTADILTHALGIGHQKGSARLQNKAKEELAAALTAIDIPQSEEKQILDSAKRAFDLEQDLYAKQ